MSLINFQLVPGIVARLRLVFLSVALVLIGAMIFGHFQIKKINNSAFELTAETFTDFPQAFEIEQHVSALVSALHSVLNARSDAGFSEASAHVQLHQRWLNDTILGLSLREPESEDALPLPEVMRDLEVQLNEALEAGRVAAEIATVVQRSVNDFGDQYTGGSKSTAMDRSIEELLQKLINLQALQAEMAGRIKEIENLTNRISDHISNRVTVRVSEIESTIQTQLATTRQLLATLAIAGLLSIALLYVANALIVERQMNRRIARLNKALAAILADESALKVDLEGNDELGLMADALETFRTNAEDLKHSNRELEKFADVAAHDLRSPLRAIQDLAEWTLEDEENRLSDTSRENMALLQKRVDRLNQLLSDLLTYSRVGRKPEEFSRVLLPKIVQSTVEILDPNGKYQVSYSGVTREVVLRASPLRLVLMNLIGNSIKHHDKDHGRIDVVARVVDGRLHMSVKDDGPGIEPQYHERIFGLFQTLRPRDEVEGSGLGLAIIRKLIERHGGSVRLTSDPENERGTIFEIDMPVKTDAAGGEDMAA